MAANIDVDVKIEFTDGIVKLFASGPEADHLIRNAAQDIAKEIEEEAARIAPEGETGRLKRHATERLNETSSTVETRAPLFVKKGATPGTQFALRGPLGFVPGVGSAGGKEVSHIEIGLPDDPKYAVWVHGGTGIFGPHGTPIVPVTQRYMVFKWHGSWHRRKTVRGQNAQPYLLEAYEYVDHTYVPRRVEELKLALSELL